MAQETDVEQPLEEPLVTRGVADGVAVITLNRPDRLNALSHDLLVVLREEMAAAANDDRVRAVVLTGAGRMFSAGADLKGGPSRADEVLRAYYNPLVADMVALDKPLVCALNGPAVGAGVSLALACDLRIAAESAFVQLAFTKVGFVPDAGSTWLLPRIVGHGRAVEMAMTARPVAAPEAREWGLVSRVVSDGLALGTALTVAGELAALPRTSRLVRGLLLDGGAQCLADHLGAEATAQGLAQDAPEHTEARLAFAEKRLPKFAVL